MRALERFLLLQIIDERWREHLFDMDYLREGIHLRGFAQIDPLVAYKNEAFTLFGDLMNSVWTDYTRMIFNVQVNVEGQNGGGGRRRRSAPAFAAGRQLHARGPRLATPAGSSAMGAGALAAAAAAGGVAGRAGVRRRTAAKREALPVVEQRVVDRRARRSGATTRAGAASGKKFKRATAA